MNTLLIGSRLRRCLTGLGAILVAAPAVAGVGVWTSSGPYGGSNYTLNVYEAAPSTLYASGRGGMFRSGSSGSSWVRIEVGLPDALVVSSVATATNAPVLFLSTYTQLFRSGNAGDLWVPISTPLTPDSYITDVSLQRASSTKLAIATTAGAYVSTNGGSTWVGPGSSGGTTAQFSKILFTADGSLYLGIDYTDPSIFGGAAMLKSTDGGSTWTPLMSVPATLGGISALVAAPSDPQRLYASDGISVTTSANGGASWTAVTLPSSGTGCGRVGSIALHPTNPLSLFVACSANGVHFTANVAAPAWTDWTQANGLTANGTDPVQAHTLAIHPGYPATGSIWAGTYDAGLFSTTTAGSTWASVNEGYQSTNIRALAPHPLDKGTPDAVVLAGYGDSATTTRALYKSSNGGGTWQPSVTGLNAEQIRAITIDPTTVDINPLSAENFTVYAAGRSERIPTLLNKDGGIYKSTDAGNTWTTIDNGVALVFGVRDMGTVRSIAPDPRSCAMPPPSGPCPIGSGPLQTIFAAGSGRPDLSAPGLAYRSARIYKSTNAGGLWTPSETGLPLPQELGPPGAFNYVYSAIVPLVFDPVNPQTMYIGAALSWDTTVVGATEPTIPNGVFKSTDGGATWVHSSNGLPHYGSPASSQYDALALAINPVNPQTLYVGVINFNAFTSSVGRIFKTTDGGANWIEASTGIAGQDVRALFIDPMDPTGDTVYAGTGGSGANPGGVYVTTNGGVSWNSLSIGLPADAALALAMPPRALGAPARIIAGTIAGIWEFTAAADPDSDGSPSAVENSVLAGDGNGDGTPDANQTSVASLSAPGSVINGQTNAPDGSIVQTTISIVPGTGACTQLNDSTVLQADLYPPDPAGAAGSHTPWGLVSFSLPNCSFAKVRVKFHGAAFNANWTWRNYGPRTPGNATTFGWYSFAGARRIDAQTWELSIDATRQGNYRNDSNDILFIGGPGDLPDVIFDHGFE